MSSKSRPSSGHKLGQLVGDWFEQYVAVLLLEKVAHQLGLYLDHRHKKRSCRSGKIIWSDLDGNNVDYDFVLELGGTDSEIGIPLAFFETFWRRGARHSKDKARDDSGKLMPMRETYPTARVLGIIAAGDFTRPAQELVRSRSIDLFYIPKAKITEAWELCGVPMDYDDSADEVVKAKIADNANEKLTDKKQQAICQRLVNIVGKAAFDSYVQRVVAGVAAVPIEYHITPVYIGKTMMFSSYQDALDYLRDSLEKKTVTEPTLAFKYEVVFSDGNLFERESLNRDATIDLHRAVGDVGNYFSKYHESKA